MPRLNTFESIQSYIDKSGGPDSCWMWLKKKNPTGYGVSHFNGKEIRAHRLMFKFVHGYLPEAVCHTCDNPSCVNPKHLFPGNNLINSRDRKNKGRNPDLKGEKHPLSKLTKEKVYEIRSFIDQGLDNYEIASMFNVSDTCIRDVRNKRRWGWLE